MCAGVSMDHDGTLRPLNSQKRFMDDLGSCVDNVISFIISMFVLFSL